MFATYKKLAGEKSKKNGKLCSNAGRMLNKKIHVNSFTKCSEVNINYFTLVILPRTVQKKLNSKILFFFGHNAVIL